MPQHLSLLVEAADSCEQCSRAFDSQLHCSCPQRVSPAACSHAHPRPPTPLQGPAVRASSRRKAPDTKAAKQLEDLKDMRERRAARSKAKAPADKGRGKGRRQRDESEEEESEAEEGAVSSEDEVSSWGWGTVVLVVALVGRMSAE